ncbi:MAG TPA: lytic murein transglycosylase [Stellaceae bacterium]|jgi:membrane-bound lytic murein transglycosylase B|nr:lytic murein transglycosylase [Stellaceae bacterium]
MLHRRVSRRSLLAAPLVAAPALIPGLPAWGAEGDAENGFTAFLDAVRREAATRGIRVSTIDDALRYAEYLPHVIELDQHQPEQVLTFAEYLQKTVTPQREENARRQLFDNQALLDAIWRRYLVEPRFIVALWGLESDFGAVTGNYMVVASLATLAFNGRRGPYFRSELISALRIVDEGNIAAGEMTGSWAGAMGQCQFMPSTFLGYAVDYDGDGRRNIWTDRADVLASIANFLAHLGWRDGESWGRLVVLPPGFDARYTGLEIRRPTFEWSRMGVRSAGQGPLSARDLEASLVLPDGAGGPAFLVYDNFRTIMRWNKSTYFAAAVGYLADSMIGGERIERG